jgi:hypothetical protein
MQFLGITVIVSSGIFVAGKLRTNSGAVVKYITISRARKTQNM